MITLFAVKKMRVAKKTTENPNQQQPTCAQKEIARNKDMLMEENAAYGHVTYMQVGKPWSNNDHINFILN